MLSSVLQPTVWRAEKPLKTSFIDSPDRQEKGFSMSPLFRFAILLLALISPTSQASERELLIYCGITMVRPISEIAQNFEKAERVKVRISQGGSEDLYQSAKQSKQGDLYLPGEPSYRELYLAEGLLGDFVTVGLSLIHI